MMIIQLVACWSIDSGRGVDCQKINLFCEKSARNNSSNNLISSIIALSDDFGSSASLNIVQYVGCAK